MIGHPRARSGVRRTNMPDAVAIDGRTVTKTAVAVIPEHTVASVRTVWRTECRETSCCASGRTCHRRNSQFGAAFTSLRDSGDPASGSGDGKTSAGRKDACSSGRTGRRANGKAAARANVTSEASKVRHRMESELRGYGTGEARPARHRRGWPEAVDAPRAMRRPPATVHLDRTQACPVWG